MLLATPPRRTTRSSTRNDRETLCSWSAMSWSANRPGKCIRWSVAIEPVTAIFMWALEVRETGGAVTPAAYRHVKQNRPPRERDGLLLRYLPETETQWNESPQAHEFCAFGLSIVKP